MVLFKILFILSIMKKNVVVFVKSSIVPGSILLLIAALFIVTPGGNATFLSTKSELELDTGLPRSAQTDLLITSDTEEILASEPLDSFGFSSQKTEYEEGTIRRNESFYLILRRHGLSALEIQRLTDSSRGVVNLKRLLPGQKYRIYYENEKPISFVWMQSPLQFVRFDWDTELSVERGSLPVTPVESEYAGIISSSLYESMSDRNGTPQLVNELADLFAWQVNFFGLQKGDHFKVVYEELFANGEFIGIGDIQFAEFQHKGEVFRAYLYEHPDRTGYFDEHGNSLQKELLKAPFKYSQRISSGFSHSRFHPVLKTRRPHYGTDYAAPKGTPVLAVGDGVVTEAQYRGANGNIVQIRHNSTYRTAYLHLNGFAKGIYKGAKVTQGTVIGYVGNTGLSTGPHLCYRLYKNDQPVNSRNIDLPASDSLEEVFHEDFSRVVERGNLRLQYLPLQQELASNLP